MADKVGLYGVMRLYSAADGFHYSCKMCHHVAEPFDTKQQRKAGYMAHLRDCWPEHKEKVNG